MARAVFRQQRIASEKLTSGREFSGFAHPRSRSDIPHANNVQSLDTHAPDTHAPDVRNSVGSVREYFGFDASGIGGISLASISMSGGPDEVA
jgi:hypothetical protein